jgi:transcriptional regulator with XRE-family HTH domain
VNKQFFLALIASSPYGSQRQFAFAMGIDPGGFSRLLTGERKMQLDEAQQIAKLLDTPLSEVLAQAGVEGLERGPMKDHSFPNIPKDLRSAIRALSPKDPVWDVLRAAIKVRK